jgi:hypothetical protein
MNAIDKIPYWDISLGVLLEALSASPDAPLLFRYDGRLVKSGYHITEVKAGQFSALDCGANPEAWSEIFVQLWDVEEGGRTHMPAGKFAAIIRKVSEHVQLEGSAKLTFEVSDGTQPMQLYCASKPTIGHAAICIELAPRTASCKPRDRWLAEQSETAACCRSMEAECCG